MGTIAVCPSYTGGSQKSDFWLPSGRFYFDSSLTRQAYDIGGDIAARTCYPRCPAVRLRKRTPPSLYSRPLAQTPEH